MNCQDHLYRNLHPRLVTRRWFFEQCGVGLGAAALAHLMAEAGYACRRSAARPRRRTSRPRRSASSSSSWPARPAIWSCSTTSRSSRSSTARCPRPTCSRAIAPRSSIPTRSCSVPSSSSPATASAAPSCPSCCRTWRGRRRHRHRQVDGHRRLQSRARADPDEHRHHAVRPAEHGRLGAVRAWARRRRTCPASSSSAPARKGRAAAIAAGAAASCPPSTRAFSSAPAAIRCSTSRTRAASTASCSAIRSMLCNQLNEMRSGVTGDPEIATRINSFEMAFRMQAGAPEVMDIAQRAEADARAVRRRAGQAVVRQQLPAGAPAASRGACASCSSFTRRGTSTATS